MKRLFFCLSVSAAALSSCAQTKPVESDGWKFIGDKWVTFGVDHDAIHLGDLRDSYSQIVVRVTDAPLRMYDMKVHFDNGGVQDIALRSKIPQGGQSRIIDLQGGRRNLKKIEFWYETKGRGRGRARVAVWGR
ncbi:MAG: hypothetical protein KBF37_02435 [Saprospiraceae bacterium]|jgi:hypothetical protein|nr:hypothetical protein [Saprospiraceae bacterium]MBP9209156.1 hypothetical protein [Saprospiraceae bacterium]